ncbi:hypothetical protein J8273_3520 [Carpediemonas membranifera]|uniref:Uncharacterized protein n=1 Tax=Carpediemonas membranifera TaxID=201153 RepID=A0A8J6DZB2_9EUKA|nr:hypothetical protein J8273_3520 [Carpediemonas membranifera]|eukprot:KAG9393384.1 hypothetical protein J8273_3520 [Carpediemonas membranifera]
MGESTDFPANIPTSFKRGYDLLAGLNLAQYAAIVEHLKVISDEVITPLVHGDYDGPADANFLCMTLAHNLFSVLHSLRQAQSIRAVCGPKLSENELQASTNLNSCYEGTLDFLESRDQPFQPIRPAPDAIRVVLSHGGKKSKIPHDAKIRLKKAVLKSDRPKNVTVLGDWQWGDSGAKDAMTGLLCAGESVVTHSVVIMATSAFKKHLRRIIITNRRVMLYGVATADEHGADLLDVSVPVEDVTVTNRSTQSVGLKWRGKSATVTFPNGQAAAVALRIPSVQMDLRKLMDSQTIDRQFEPLYRVTVKMIDSTLSNLESTSQLSVGLGSPLHPFQLAVARSALTSNVVHFDATRYHEVTLSVILSDVMPEPQGEPTNAPTGKGVVQLGELVASLKLPENENGVSAIETVELVSASDSVVGTVTVEIEVTLQSADALPEVLPALAEKLPLLYQSQATQFSANRTSGLVTAQPSNRGVALFRMNRDTISLEDGATFATLAQVKLKRDADGCYSISYAGIPNYVRFNSVNKTILSGDFVVYRMISKMEDEILIIDSIGAEIAAISSSDVTVLGEKNFSRDLALLLMMGALNEWEAR